MAKYIMKSYWNFKICKKIVETASLVQALSNVPGNQQYKGKITITGGLMNYINRKIICPGSHHREVLKSYLLLTLNICILQC